MMKWVHIVRNLVIFSVSLILLIAGQKNIGLPGLCVMLVGLAGMLFLLYSYNKKYQ